MSHILSCLVLDSACPAGQGYPEREDTAMEDDQAAVELREREEELVVGARALARRLRDLQAEGGRLRGKFVDAKSKEEQLALLDRIESLDEDVRSAKWEKYVLTAAAIGADYGPSDVALWCDRAVDMGASHPRLSVPLLLDLLHLRKVPNAPFREHYLSMNANEFQVVDRVLRCLQEVEAETGRSCGSAGMTTERGSPRVLKRWLGIDVGVTPKGVSLRLFLTYEQAVALQRAFGMTPQSAGI